MNKRFLLPIVLMALALPIQAVPSAGDAQLAESIVGRYYRNQNITDDAGSLRESIVIEQDILTIEDGSESRVTAHLFMKDSDTYLVYLKNERNESICYLYRGDRQWVYRENLRNPMRVNMSQNVSGSANLGDLIGIDILRDFELTSVSRKTQGDELTYERVRSSYPYPTILITADSASGDITSIEYQGLGERSMRRVELKDYSILPGNHRIPTWRISNLVTDVGDVTEIRYRSIEPIDIPGSYFSPNGNALGHFLKWCDGAID